MQVIEAEGLSFSYDKEPVLSGISFAIEKGDFVAVIGPNGAGKTTLVKLLLGLLPPGGGSLSIMGTSVEKCRQRSLIGYVPQRHAIDRLFPGTVREILDAKRTKEAKLHPILGIEPLLAKRFVDLSGGQQQRVLIALALLNGPKILILDEPTVGVDPKTEEEFFRLLKHLNREHHLTILMVTHEVGMVPTIAGKVLCLSHNTSHMGPASKTKELLKRAYGSYETFGDHHA